MTHKKNIILFFISSLLIISILPVINVITHKQAIITKDLFNRDSLESFIHYFFYKNLKKSLVNNEVIIGENGYLFLGNKYGKAISKTQNIYPITQFGVYKWVNNLTTLQQWYESQNIKFVMTVVPNKHSIYPEELPKWVSYEQNNITDKLIKEASKRSLNIVDLRGPLLHQKQILKQPIYFKSDSHWNAQGASIGYEATLDFLNKQYGEQYTKQSHQFIYQHIGGKGLSRLLKINDKLSHNFEQTPLLKISNEHLICQGGIDKQTKQIQPCQMVFNKAIDIHKGARYSIDKDALNHESVLFLCDSFSVQNSRLFNFSFQSIWRFHYNKLLGEELKTFVEKNKPKIVIYQIVERALYKNNFINHQF